LKAAPALTLVALTLLLAFSIPTSSDNVVWTDGSDPTFCCSSAGVYANCKICSSPSFSYSASSISSSSSADSLGLMVHSLKGRVHCF